MRKTFHGGPRMDALDPASGRARIRIGSAKSASLPFDKLAAALPWPKYFHRLDFGRPSLAVALTQNDLRRLFELLNDELRRSGTRGELFLVGGAVMCLAYAARPSTQDVDALFRPPAQVREAAARVAARAKVKADWLNDGVKGFVSAQGEFAPFLELDHLRIMVALPEYLLAMKCLAMRIGAEFHDEDDVRYLLRHLDIRTQDEALAVITKYYPLERFPQKTLYALAELLPNSG
jgi:hypothetical protein